MQDLPPEPLRPWQVAVAGMVAMAVAMGIGRFAFTPLLPMMLADGVTNLASASWLASANYLGYLVGALLCTFQPLVWQKVGKLPPVHATAMVRVGLGSTVLLTLGMTLQVPTVWPLMRFLAGVVSALVFVYTSCWCLGQFARLKVPAMGALIYIGPGGGIVLSGVAVSAMVAQHRSAATGWIAFGLLAALLTALVWPLFSARHDVPTTARQAPSASGATGSPTHGGIEVALLAMAYGLAGFGYIITATFLPVIARQTLPGSAWLDLFWPLFGLGVVAGALIASRVRSAGDFRVRLAFCYAVQALAITASLVFPNLAGFITGSLLLGLPFTAITFFAMQEVRRLRPAHVSSTTGLVTAVYGLGQIAGPPLVALLLARSASVGAGFNLSLEIAVAALALGVLLYGVMVRAYPLAQPGHRAWLG